MVFYKKMYLSIFNDITDAVKILKTASTMGEVKVATGILEKAQLKTEKMYLSSEYYESQRNKITVTTNHI